MKPYAVDLRERLLGAIDAGLSQAEAARLFGVGTSTITRWRQQRRDTGSLAPKPRTGRRPAIGPQEGARLQAQVARHTGGALHAVGRRAGRARKRGDDVAGDPPPRDHAQKSPPRQ